MGHRLCPRHHRPPPHKLRKLRQLLATKKVSRKALQQCLGLLVWATSTSAHLRPQLAPLYRDLNSPPGTMYGIHAPQWRLFLDALSTDLHFIKPVMGLHLPLKTKILEYAGRRCQGRPATNSAQLQATVHPGKQPGQRDHGPPKGQQGMYPVAPGHLPAHAADALGRPTLPHLLLSRRSQGRWGPGRHRRLGGEP